MLTQFERFEAGHERRVHADGVRHVRTKSDRHDVVFADLRQLPVAQQIEPHISGRYQIRCGAPDDQRRK